MLGLDRLRHGLAGSAVVAGFGALAVGDPRKAVMADVAIFTIALRCQKAVAATPAINSRIIAILTMPP